MMAFLVKKRRVCILKCFAWSLLPGGEAKVAKQGDTTDL